MLHNRDIWNISGQQTLEVKLATGCTQKKIRNQRVTHPTNPLCIALCRSVPTTAAEQLKGVEASLAFSHSNTKYNNMAVCRNLVPLVNIKIAGKWMFIPLKMVLIGIDPYPYIKSAMIRNYKYNSCNDLQWHAVKGCKNKWDARFIKSCWLPHCLISLTEYLTCGKTLTNGNPAADPTGKAAYVYYNMHLLS